MAVELVLVLISSLWLMEPLAAAPSMAKHGCNDSCGGVPIPYPFGFGAEHCYHEKGFEITCNESANYNTAKPFLRQFNLEVLNISLDDHNVIVNVPIPLICEGHPWTSTNLTGSPFLFSSENRFTVRGCGNALITNQSEIVLGGCTVSCNNNYSFIGCYGIDCCQTSIPLDLAIYKIHGTETCTHSSLWYSQYSPISAIASISSAPVLLLWMIKSLDNLPNQRCYEYHPTTDNQTLTACVCQCPFSYEGNPYIIDGCEVIPACAGCIRSCARGYGNYTGSVPYYKYYCDRSYEEKEKKSLKAVIIGNTPMYHVSSVYLCASYHRQENCIMHDPHPKSMWLFTKQIITTGAT